MVWHTSPAGPFRAGHLRSQRDVELAGITIAQSYTGAHETDQRASIRREAHETGARQQI